MGAADLSCKCIAKLSGNGIPIPSSSPNMFFLGGEIGSHPSMSHAFEELAWQTRDWQEAE